MITFHRVFCKNFFSVGDKGLEIVLDRSPTTLVAGTNGSGKSSCILDSITFAIFGKAFRKINLGQLVNSVNGKECLVELEFTTDKRYKVIRGLKPSIFEIYCEGELISQDAHTRDYQEVLESSILRVNFKTFTQVAILGSASYIPFMELPTGHRREVIENLLDIDIFSSMNSLLKERAAKLKDQIKDLQYKIQLLKEKKSLQQSHILSLKKLQEEASKSVDDEIVSLQNQIDQLQSSNQKNQIIIDENLSKWKTIAAEVQIKMSELSSQQSEQKREMQQLVKDAKFYQNTDSCPTCAQVIPTLLRDQKLDDAKSSAKALTDAMTSLQSEYEKTSLSQKEAQEVIDRLSKLSNKISANNSVISSHRSQIKKMQSRTAPTDSKASEDILISIDTELVQTTSDLSVLNEDKDYNDAVAELLKDSGIKTRVIRQYLPMMNKLINDYLQVLDFFVSFHLDESFSETIKSRHRDAFTYPSFSEGEKARINLAILMSWRKLAAAKNSAATNLLILDEIFDGSIDGEGVENLFAILNSLEAGTNCFVISHKHEALAGKFAETLHFSKVSNFTTLRVE